MALCNFYVTLPELNIPFFEKRITYTVYQLVAFSGYYEYGFRLSDIIEMSLDISYNIQ